MTLSSAARRRVFRTYLSTDVVPLITLSHPSLGSPVRLASLPPVLSTGVTDFEALGETWLRCPMIVRFPPRSEETPQCEIQMPVFSPDLGEQVAALSGRRVRFTLTGVLADTPTVEEVEPVTLDMVDVTVNASGLTGTLMAVDPSQEPWPILRATADVAPGVRRTAA